MDTRIGKDYEVMRALHYSVVIKRELSKKAKLSIFKTAFVPNLTYGHELWIITERVRSQVQASEMNFLQRIEGVITLFNKGHRSEIQKSLDIEPLHFSELKDIGLDGWPCTQNASWKTPQTSFTCQSKWEKNSSWTT